MDVNSRIREHLRQNGVSQAFLSEKAKIPPAKLNLALNGHRRLRLEEYEAICWALGVRAGTFLEPAPLPDAGQRGA